MNKGFLDHPIEITDSRVVDFFIVDNVFVDKAQGACGCAASAIYISICRHADAQKTARPSIRRLGKEIGVSQVTIQRGLKILEGFRLIDIIHGEKGEENKYRVRDKLDWNIPIKNSVENSVENTGGVSATDTGGVSATDTGGVSATDTPKHPLYICSTKRLKDLKTNVAGSCDWRACPARLAARLYDRICENNPKTKLLAASESERNASIQRWAVDIDLLLRKDRQQPSIVEEVIEFATHDDFWGSNILSAKKLRNHWDTLVSRMERQARHKPHSGACSPPPASATGTRPPLQRNIFKTKAGWMEKLSDGTDVSIAEADLPKKKPANAVASIAQTLAEKMGVGTKR